MNRRNCLHKIAVTMAISALGARALTEKAAPPLAGTNSSLLVLFLDDSEGPQGKRLDEFRSALSANRVLSNRIRMEVITVDISDESRFYSTMVEAVTRNPLVFVTASTDIARRTKRYIQNIPLIFGTMGDPLQLDIVDSLGARQRNATGFTYDIPIVQKSLEVLTDAFPRARRVGVLADTVWVTHFAAGADLSTTQKKLGIHTELVILDRPSQIDSLVRRLNADSFDAIYLPRTDVIFENKTRDFLIAQFQTHRVPHLFPHEGHVKAGGLMSYGVRMSSHWESMARMVALVLAGVPAREIPIERPKDFVLAVNAGQANAMGINISKSILRRANLII